MGSLPLIPTGATGILAIVVGLILWGKLVPSRIADQRNAGLREQLDETKQDRDMWKAAYFRQVNISGQLVGQVDTLMEVGRTTDHIVQSLPTLEETGEGRTDEVSTP